MTPPLSPIVDYNAYDYALYLRPKFRYFIVSFFRKHLYSTYRRGEHDLHYFSNLTNGILSEGLLQRCYDDNTNCVTAVCAQPKEWLTLLTQLDYNCLRLGRINFIIDTLSFLNTYLSDNLPTDQESLYSPSYPPPLSLILNPLRIVVYETYYLIPSPRPSKVYISKKIGFSVTTIHAAFSVMPYYRYLILGKKIAIPLCKFLNLDYHAITNSLDYKAFLEKIPKPILPLKSIKGRTQYFSSLRQPDKDIYDQQIFGKALPLGIFS